MYPWHVFYFLTQSATHRNDLIRTLFTLRSQLRLVYDVKATEHPRHRSRLGIDTTYSTITNTSNPWIHFSLFPKFLPLNLNINDILVSLNFQLSSNESHLSTSERITLVLVLKFKENDPVPYNLPSNSLLRLFSFRNGQLILLAPPTKVLIGYSWYWLDACINRVRHALESRNNFSVCRYKLNGNINENSDLLLRVAVN